MVLRILLGSVFGALFGYVLGWFIELFPGFNAAILEGLRVIIGLNGVHMTALLAGIGFLGGIVVGFIGSLLHEAMHHKWHEDWHRYWRRDWI
jgi:MFS family permease